MLNLTASSSRLLPLVLLALALQVGAEAPDAAQLTFTKWTPDFQVPDPVAITLDNEGRAFVTQTQRRKAQDLDIRRNRDWIPADVALQTVAEKKAFFHSRLAPALSAENSRRVSDSNNDGSHDWRDLTTLSERIHLLTDSDGDGLADKQQLFAEDFNTEVTGIAAGILWHDNHLYATVAPDVWKIPVANPADRKVIAHGFGLHVAYAGHDMHGPTVGPDGRLYWSIGDKGISVTTADGTRHHYPNQGGVMRCEFDGSNFEVFAHGLRNVQELAFDAFGNLFGVDNDADFRGEKERFVYIVEGMDAGWRCNYQYRGKDYNPWMAERLWQPANDAQPAYLLPPIQNYVNGPAGFVYNPGTALGPDYHGFFFLSQFSSGRQNAFRVEPDGASFRMVDDHVIGKGNGLIGLSFGPDGALYGVDWGGGYALNRKGAVWKIDNPKFAKSAARLQTAQLLRTGVSDRQTAALLDLLAHADQRVRLAAQFELANRQATAELATVAGSAKRPLLARIHAVWGLNQLHRHGLQASPAVATALRTAAAASAPADLRIQVARWLRECTMTNGHEPIRQFIADADPRLRFHGAMAAARTPVKDLRAPLVAMLATGKADTPYLRLACQRALAGSCTSAELADLATSPSPAVRLAAVVALRHQSSPAVAAFLKDADSAVAREAAHAIHDDFSIPDAMPALAAVLATTTHTGEAFLRRAINANFRLGRPADAARLAGYAADSAKPAAMRHEALAALIDWSTPNRLDRVTGRDRPGLQPRATDPIKNAVAGHLDALLADSDAAIKTRALALVDRLELNLPPGFSERLVVDKKVSVGVRLQAAKSLNLRQPAAFHEMSERLLADGDASFRAGILPLLATAANAAEILATVLDDPKASVPEKQAALTALPQVGNAAADAVILTWLQRLLAGKVPAPLQLDVELAAAARPDNRAVAAQLTAYRAKFGDDWRRQYASALAGGDPIRGEDLFMNHVAAACIRCHRVAKGPGSTIGPNLLLAGRQKPDYLVESLLEPGAVIAKGFGMITVTQTDGTVTGGTLYDDAKDAVTVRLPDNSLKTIPRAKITAATEPISSMPPMGNILDKSEFRDLLAYLATLR